MNLLGNKSSDISVLRVKSQSFLVFFLILSSSCSFSSNSSYVSSSIFPLLHSFSFILLLLLLLHSAFPPYSSSFSSSWILLYFTFFSLLLVFHLLLLSLFFPFISLSHSFILLFLYLPFLLPYSSCFYLLSFISITVYSSSFFSSPSSLPLFFLLHSLLSIFSVLQSPYLYIYIYFFCTYSSSTLFSPSLSLSFIPSLSSPSCC